MKTFLGIGAGPIQTGIFVRGAVAAGFNRIVLADVDAALVDAIRKSGCITVNTVGKNGVRSDNYNNIEIYNLQDAFDLPQLIDIASEAQVLSMALPPTGFYRHIAWLRDAFGKKPEHRRYIYVAENSEATAAELRAVVGDFPAAFYLDTVIGRMSRIFDRGECNLPTLTPDFPHGHLIDDLNMVYCSSARGLDDVALHGLNCQPDLQPFKEAQRYGHDAARFLLAGLASRKGCHYLSEAVEYPELLRTSLMALRDECGEALCRKFAGMDEFFSRDSFATYSANMVERMVATVWNDNVDSIVRNPSHVFAWNAPIIGAIRLCLAQGIYPAALCSGIVLPEGTVEQWATENNYNFWEATAVQSLLRTGRRFIFASASCEQVSRYCGSPEQLASARMSCLSEGDGRGTRIIDVNNGSGLSFTVVPDRGMDIVDASYKGVPLVFRAPAGYVNPGRVRDQNFDWLRTWAGGLMTTCGLRHVGPPEDDCNSSLDPHRGLHGRISAHSAEDVGIIRQWNLNHYELHVSGTLREAMMFGENLRLERKILTAMGDNAIYIEDTVRNYGCVPEFIQILYHCNFGYPVVMPGTTLEAGEHEITPRDAEAATGLDRWAVLGNIQPGAAEQCFLHMLCPTTGRWAEIGLHNRELGLKITLAYDTATLPRLMQWKLEDAGRYVIGLEPTNTTVAGRSADIRTGIAPKLLPGDALKFSLKISFADI